MIKKERTCLLRLCWLLPIGRLFAHLIITSTTTPSRRDFQPDTQLYTQNQLTLADTSLYDAWKECALKLGKKLHLRNRHISKRTCIVTAKLWQASIIIFFITTVPTDQKNVIWSGENGSAHHERGIHDETYPVHQPDCSPPCCWYSDAFGKLDLPHVNHFALWAKIG